jgi:hypothetical protein
MMMFLPSGVVVFPDGVERALQAYPTIAAMHDNLSGPDVVTARDA